MKNISFGQIAILNIDTSPEFPICASLNNSALKWNTEAELMQQNPIMIENLNF
jgi:hypothetical protein